jgi:hypothetical protein
MATRCCITDARAYSSDETNAQITARGTARRYY